MISTSLPGSPSGIVGAELGNKVRVLSVSFPSPNQLADWTVDFRLDHPSKRGPHDLNFKVPTNTEEMQE